MPDQMNTQPIFNRMAIVGVGLIGGSLGMAARRHKLVSSVVGIGRSEPKLMRAKLLGAIDEYTLDMESGAAGADLVVVCTPVRTIVPTLRRLAPRLDYGAIVSDVGSTKGELVREAEEIVSPHAHFIGGHPMAGSEQSGVESAFPDLFVGATYVITPSEGTDLKALAKLTAFVVALGAKAEIMSPEEHDRAVAVISHLPHAISSALLQLAELAQKDTGKAFRLAAGSFRDLTRISDSPPEIWRDICLTNSEALIDAIDRLVMILNRLREAVLSKDEKAVEGYFEVARNIRDTFVRMSKL